MFKNFRIGCYYLKFLTTISFLIDCSSILSYIPYIPKAVSKIESFTSTPVLYPCTVILHFPLCKKPFLKSFLKNNFSETTFFSRRWKEYIKNYDTVISDINCFHERELDHLVTMQGNKIMIFNINAQ